jgi:hypothetical protein
MGRASSPRASQSSSASLNVFKLCAMKAYIGKGILREKQKLRRKGSGGRMELIDGSALQAAIAFSKGLKFF